MALHAMAAELRQLSLLWKKKRQNMISQRTCFVLSYYTNLTQKNHLYNAGASNQVWVLEVQDVVMPPFGCCGAEGFEGAGAEAFGCAFVASGRRAKLTTYDLSASSRRVSNAKVPAASGLGFTFCSMRSVHAARSAASN